eukprot:353327-Chlamydomonas_euryale.AAC.1
MRALARPHPADPSQGSPPEPLTRKMVGQSRDMSASNILHTHRQRRWVGKCSAAAVVAADQLRLKLEGKLTSNLRGPSVRTAVHAHAYGDSAAMNLRAAYLLASERASTLLLQHQLVQSVEGPAVVSGQHVAAKCIHVLRWISREIKSPCRSSK